MEWLGPRTVKAFAAAGLFDGEREEAGARFERERAGSVGVNRFEQDREGTTSVLSRYDRDREGATSVMSRLDRDRETSKEIVTIRLSIVMLPCGTMPRRVRRFQRLRVLLRLARGARVRQGTLVQDGAQARHSQALLGLLFRGAQPQRTSAAVWDRELVLELEPRSGMQWEPTSGRFKKNIVLSPPHFSMPLRTPGGVQETEGGEWDAEGKTEGVRSHGESGQR